MKRAAKTPSYAVALITVWMLFCGSPGFAKGQSSGTTDSLVEHRAFVFRAQWAIAYTGSRRQLTPPYELLVTSDSIACYLPFVGRMYTVPTPEDLRFMSIHFTSKKFSYAKERTKRGWDVAITPADVRDVSGLYFTLSHDGWGMLTIRSGGRDPMSYEGTIEPVTD